MIEHQHCVWQLGEMTMVFFQSTTTPLLFDFWTPRNAGEYAAACISIVALAAITRVLFAVRSSVEHRYVGWGRPGYRYQPDDHAAQGSGQGHEGESAGAAAGAVMEDDWDWKSQSLEPLRADVHSASKKMLAVVLAMRQQWKNFSLMSRLVWAVSETVLVGLGYLL